MENFDFFIEGRYKLLHCLIDLELFIKNQDGL